MTTDFDLRGVIGVRVLGSARDAAIVRRQLGPLDGPLSGDPDIVVRFVDRIEARAPLRLIGSDDAAFTDDAFLLLRSRHKAQARVLLPLGELGARPFEILCERRAPAVPMLVAIVNTLALDKGFVPLHASAFVHEGRGVLVTGWSKGGKTETLLAFMAHGAGYVGDEWVYLSPDRGQMLGLPEPMKLWDWHIADSPYRRGIGTASRVRLAAGRTALEAAARLAPRVGRARGSLYRAMALLRQQQYVEIGPQELFGAAVLDSAPIDEVVYAISTDAPRVRVEPFDAAELARRMAFSVQHERLDLVACYLKFRFAFPDRQVPIIESAGERERELLDRALRDRRCHALFHPYPVRLGALYEALAPIVSAPAHGPVRAPGSE